MIIDDEYKYFKNIFNGTDVFKYYRDLYVDSSKYVSTEKIENRLSVLISQIKDLGINIKEDNIDRQDKDSFVKLYTSYGKYVNVMKLLEYIMSISNEESSSYSLNYFIEFYLLQLDRLKSDGVFIRDDFSKYIVYFYKLGYHLMKLEFMYNYRSKIYDYFSSNYHDINIMKSFISIEIKELMGSINYVYGLDYIESKLNDDSSLFSKNVILYLIFTYYPDKVKSVIYGEIDFYYRRFRDIKKFNDYYERRLLDYRLNPFRYFSYIRRLKKEYKNTLNEYREFLSENETLIKGLNSLDINQKKFNIADLIIKLKY